jgi:uncharacterized membrane protein required for colicin V production
MGEPLLTILLLAAILYMGRIGAIFGLFQELTTLVAVLFAALATIRYWYLGTKLVTWLTLYPTSSTAFAAFWLLFVAVGVPLIGLTRLIAKDFRPEYPKLLDKMLGFIFGATSGAVLACCLMTSLSVLMPKVWNKYDPAALLVRWHRIAPDLYRHIERDWFGITEDHPGHTRLPALGEGDPDDLDGYWR